MVQSKIPKKIVLLCSQSCFHAKFPRCCVKFLVRRAEHSSSSFNASFKLNCIYNVYVLFKNCLDRLPDYLATYRIYFNRGGSFKYTQLTQHCLESTSGINAYLPGVLVKNNGSLAKVDLGQANYCLSPISLMKVSVGYPAIFLLNLPFDQYTGIKIDVRHVHFALP